MVEGLADVDRRGFRPGRFLIYAPEWVARVPDVFFVRLVVRGRVVGASPGSG